MIQIKNAAELEKMRKAAAISAAALKAGGEAIEPGITTAEIDKIIYDFIVRHGARPNFLHLYGFPATACISVNDTVIHGIPSRDQKIRPGDIVSIDTGCKIDGFNGDNACTFACGKLDLEAQRPRRQVQEWGISATQCKATWRRTVSPLCVNMLATALARSCTKTPKFPIMGMRAVGSA